MSEQAHWQLTIDEQNIAWLGFDRYQQHTNTINTEVLTQLDLHLSTLAENKKLSGLIIYSEKENGLCAGADIDHFSSFNDSERLRQFLQYGQAVFKKLADFPKPTVAMIHGFCVGGGMELSLACDARIARDDLTTKLGLPEVKLGILPGWGGTVRLTQLINPLTALQLILTGRTLSAKAAKKVSLADEAVPLRVWKRAAIHYCLQPKKPANKPFWQQMLLAPPMRRLIAWFVRRQTEKKAKPQHYPNVFSIINLFEQHGGDSKNGFKAEIDELIKLTETEQTPEQLLRVFQLQERLKAFAKQSNTPLNHVHVVGAGTMGGDIAAVCAMQGFTVSLQDQNANKCSAAMARAEKLFKKRLKQRSLITAATDRLVVDVEGYGVAKADVIIEAIFEDLTAKQQLFKSIEQRAKANAILATNTSSIPLDEINQVLSDPSRLVGIHFFNPVAKMPLVEIVIGDKTSTSAQEGAFALVGKLKKLPLPVKSTPGFLVNRVLMPYLMQCVQLLAEGIPAETIDAAATEFGMPLGPVELADTVGLDVCLSVAKNLSEHFGSQVPKLLEDKVAKSELGKKTGHGFYRYQKGKAVKASSNASKEKLDAIAKRLVDALIAESKKCLSEKVVADADLLDAGMIFGTGFAPFRGGPLHYNQQTTQASPATSEEQQAAA